MVSVRLPVCVLVLPALVACADSVIVCVPVNVLVKELQGLGLRVDLLDESEDAVIDAEQIIGSVINGEPVAAIPMSDDDEETIVDEVDDFGDLGDGVTIQDIDEIEEIKEEA